MILGIGEQFDKSLLCFVQRIDFVEDQAQRCMQCRITHLPAAGEALTVAPAGSAQAGDGVVQLALDKIEHAFEAVGGLAQLGAPQ
ncbi:hypothetical protein D3C73_1087730 [compost metagenome]